MSFLDWPKNRQGRIAFSYNQIKNNALTYTCNKATNDKLNLFFGEGKTRIYFKANGVYTEDTNEILGAILAKGIGFKNFEPIPAVYIDEKNVSHKGIVSKDYVQSRAITEVCSYDHLLGLTGAGILNYITVEEILITVKKAIYNKPITLDDQFENDLKKMCLFYYITGQQDANERNIEFTIVHQDDGKNVMSVAPFVDNSIAFFNLVKSSYTLEQVKESQGDIARSMRCPFSMDNSPFEMFEHKRTVRDLGIEISSNPVLADFFKKIVAFDFAAAIKQYKAQNPNYSITREKIYKAITMVNVKVADLAEMVNRLNKNILKDTQKQKQTDREF